MVFIGPVAIYYYSSINWRLSKEYSRCDQAGSQYNSIKQDNMQQNSGPICRNFDDPTIMRILFFILRAAPAVSKTWDFLHQLEINITLA